MKKISFVIFAVLFCLSGYAQQALWGGGDIVSPQINPDNSVTFSIFAPEAQKVEITGDFLPTQKMQTPMGEFDAPGNAALTKNEKGVWEYTTAPLAPELDSYTFIIDGVKVTDPNNVYMIRDWEETRMDGEFETHFPEVIRFVETNYRTQADKAHRAIAGLSMGGFHSLHISKEYPDKFDYIGLFSAAVMPRDGVKSPVYDNFDVKLKTQFDKKPKLYWIAIGNTDFLYQANNDFRKKLDDNKYPYTYFETGEGHIWKNWRIYLSEFAPKLF
jgi:hypothetical protein